MLHFHVLLTLSESSTNSSQIIKAMRQARVDPTDESKNTIGKGKWQVRKFYREWAQQRNFSNQEGKA